MERTTACSWPDAAFGHSVPTTTINHSTSRIVKRNMRRSLPCSAKVEVENLRVLGFRSAASLLRLPHLVFCPAEPKEGRQDGQQNQQRAEAVTHLGEGYCGWWFASNTFGQSLGEQV